MDRVFICGAADRSGRGTCCSCCCCCCCCYWGIWGDCFQISHVQPKWVHPEKTFLKNWCIQRKLFLKMGASRENFSSKWVHSQKTFAVNLMHQDKTLLQNGCIKSLSFTKFRKRIILFFKVSLHVIMVSLLM